MSKAEEIFKQIKNKPEHEMADSFNERTNDMVLDAINTALNLYPVVGSLKCVEYMKFKNTDYDI